MELEVNKIYNPLFTSSTRYILLYGGRGGGRSYTASQKVILDTVSKPYSRTAVMRYVLGDVRSSIWQEVKDRISDYALPEVISDQAMRYDYKGNTIEGKGFKKSSSQNSAKLKSLASYNTIVIEEADEVQEEDFSNLDISIRTQRGKNTIILCFNMPHKDHWIIKRWFNLVESGIDGYYKAIPKDRKDTQYLFATYEDNIKHLDESSIRVYEGYKELNPEYYYTMIKGYVSEGLKGRIFTKWKPISIKEYEELPYPEYYGLDFGFTNDPTALVGFKSHNNRIYFRELIYETHLTNQDLAARMKILGVNGMIVADSAEPKSIEEIKREGFYIISSVKGADSIRSGINLLNSKEVYYTEDSKNIAQETQKYIYKLDRDKRPTNEPEDANNHIMDACRYITTHQLGGILFGFA